MDVNSLLCCTRIFSPILGELRLDQVPSLTLKISVNAFLKCKMLGQKSLAYSSQHWGEGRSGSMRCRDLHLQKIFVLTNNMLLIKAVAVNL